MKDCPNCGGDHWGSHVCPFLPKPAGTFSCPKCGRDYPHGDEVHAADNRPKSAYQEWLLSLSARNRRHYFNCKIDYCAECDELTKQAVAARETEAGSPALPREEK